MAAITVTVRSNVGRISAQARTAAAAATAKAAHDIEAHAKTAAPHDTGHLENSINTTGGGLAYRVNSPAEYSIYQEFGTYKMAAHPFMMPAVEIVWPMFLSAMRKLV